MPRRAILLFVLFAVLALFYAINRGEEQPSIYERYGKQTEMLNKLDEIELAVGDAHPLSEQENAGN